GGTVTFTDGTSVIGTVTLDSTGKATLNISTLTAITHSITAAYSGNPTFAPSTSTAVSLAVRQGSVNTTLTSSLNPSGFGQSVTLTARVAPVSPAVTTPTGSVTFQNGTTTLGTVALTNGFATLTTANLPVGSDALTAIYSGDVNYAAGAPGSLSQKVTQGTLTISITASNLNPFPLDS